MKDEATKRDKERKRKKAIEREREKRGGEKGRK